MFLYWKKRGAYELEALPSALAGLELGAVERFSWSSTLDIIEDLGGRCEPTFQEGCRRFPYLVYLATSFWPEPVGPVTMHKPLSVIRSAGVWEPESLLRATAGGGEGPKHEDLEGLGGSKVGWALWAGQLGLKQGSQGAGLQAWALPLS